MPSEFTNHFTRNLVLSKTRPASPIQPPSTVDKATTAQQQYEPDSDISRLTSQKKAELHALLGSINQGSISVTDVQTYADRLKNTLPTDDTYTVEAVGDEEMAALVEAIIGKLAVVLYSNALDVYLTQAADVEAEAEWWADIERSKRNVALYLLQTFPLRVANVIRTIATALHRSHLPLSVSSFSPSSLRSLFPSPAQLTLRPGALTTAFFPYLKHQKSLTLAVLLAPPRPSPTPSSRIQKLRESAYSAYVFVTLPLELTRQECRYNRKALERIRDERADCLGQLASYRPRLSQVINNGIKNAPLQQYTHFLDSILQVLSPAWDSPDASGSFTIIGELTQYLPAVSAAHTQVLRAQNLLRPSALTRVWPSLLVLPPLSLYIYTNRTAWTSAIVDMARDAKETARGFLQGWLIEPLIGVLNTVRAGGKGDMLVREGGVVADLESLERMALALARDSLKYTPTQLDTLATQVRMGDLTPVMQIYEEDIRTPFRSALTGTLLRNLFIQIQKAKVDIDQALSGIDRLLKSQELTFAFVGVAPALAIVYAMLGSADRLWGVIGGKGYLGGRQRRQAVWEGMRRVEKLLILIPATYTSGRHLSTGLLILSLTRLRAYALECLPARLRTPFLEDLSELENPELDREAKLRIVDRMWRCWGTSGEGIIRL
ncbi:hypothetical protein HYPSUDRAFT_40693 [Hypholoma sublateritium FD-334 SS-4]|uniref:NCA2-domain-containing protein n=1 Tax=Hypholoma sublateritium (strain FD-334 SS-4) TaxID=945553 RepID=A0A0D2PS55_HYPSF|nr:hypothetical protein HYPSUDRAFT_40693 [Hypholoma sublateritium FD-334 SS-4]